MIRSFLPTQKQTTIEGLPRSVEAFSLELRFIFKASLSCLNICSFSFYSSHSRPVLPVEQNEE